MGQLASTDCLYGSPDAWIQNTGFHNIPVACISTCYFPCLLSQLVLGTFPQFSTRYILMPLWSLAQTQQATTAVKPRSMFPALLHLEALEGKCVSLLFSSCVCVEREARMPWGRMFNLTATNQVAACYSPYPEGNWEACCKDDGFRLETSRWRDQVSQFVELAACNSSCQKHVKWATAFCCHNTNGVFALCHLGRRMFFSNRTAESRKSYSVMWNTALSTDIYNPTAVIHKVMWIHR